MRAAARSPFERPGRDDGADRSDVGGLVDLLDGAGTFEPPQRRVQRPERDAPERAERLGQPLLQVVAVQRLLGQQPENGELEH